MVGRFMLVPLRSLEMASHALLGLAAGTPGSGTVLGFACGVAFLDVNWTRSVVAHCPAFFTAEQKPPKEE